MPNWDVAPGFLGILRFGAVVSTVAGVEGCRARFSTCACIRAGGLAGGGVGLGAGAESFFSIPQVYGEGGLAGCVGPGGGLAEGVTVRPLTDRSVTASCGAQLTLAPAPRGFGISGGASSRLSITR